MIIEKCPICNNSLEAIQDKIGYIINWLCGKCLLYWTLEDLEIKQAQKTLGEFL